MKRSESMISGMRMLTAMAVGVCLVAGIAACSKEAPPQPIIQDTGRADTRSIEAANAVGYNGAVMRQKVDQSLNAHDAVTTQINEAASQ
jgi:hypothetical protein